MCRRHENAALLWSEPEQVAADVVIRRTRRSRLPRIQTGAPDQPAP